MQKPVSLTTDSPAQTLRSQPLGHQNRDWFGSPLKRIQVQGRVWAVSDGPGSPPAKSLEGHRVRVRRVGLTWSIPTRSV